MPTPLEIIPAAVTFGWKRLSGMPSIRRTFADWNQRINRTGFGAALSGRRGVDFDCTNGYSSEVPLFQWFVSPNSEDFPVGNSPLRTVGA